MEVGKNKMIPAAIATYNEQNNIEPFLNSVGSFVVKVMVQKASEFIQQVNYTITFIKLLISKK